MIQRWENVVLFLCMAMYKMLKILCLFLQAFEDAWKKACSKRGSIFLVPKGKRYLVNATRFKGPCAGNLIIQVN